MTDLPRTVLDRAMRSVLARLELISNGTTTSYNAAGGATGENPDPRPRGGDGAPHLYWADRYSHAADDETRHAVIEGAQTEWKQLTGRGGADTVRPAGETEDEYRARVLHETEKTAPADVAQSSYRIGERTLRKWRRDDGRDPETGVRTDPAIRPGQVPAHERRALVVARKRDGMTLRQIAFSLGVSHETVRRDLKDAA